MWTILRIFVKLDEFRWFNLGIWTFDELKNSRKFDELASSFNSGWSQFQCICWNNSKNMDSPAKIIFIWMNMIKPGSKVGEQNKLSNCEFIILNRTTCRRPMIWSVSNLQINCLRLRHFVRNVIIVETYAKWSLVTGQFCCKPFFGACRSVYNGKQVKTFETIDNTCTPFFL